MDEAPHDLNAALVGMDESGSRSPPSQSRPREVSPTKVPAARRRTKVEKLPPEKAATVPGPVPMQHSERPLRYERLAEGQPVEEARSAGASEESRGARVKKLSPGRSTLSVAEPPATRADGHSPAHSARSAKSSRVSPTSRGTRTSPTRLGHRVEEHRVEDMFLPPKQHSAGSVAEPRQESQAAQEFLTDGEEHESERGREAPVQRPKPKRVKPLSSSTSTSPLAKRIEPLPSSTSTSPLVKRIESLSSSTSGRGPIPAAPAVQDLSGAEKERAERDLDAALRACRGGVVWPHVRLMVRGGGGEGKTSTIGAMSGKTFEASQKSTVGAGTLDVELRQEALEAGGGSGCPLQPHQRVADEYVAALAGQAAEGAAAPAASMLDAPRAAARAGRGPAPGAAPPRAAAEECVVAVAPAEDPSRALPACPAASKDLVVRYAAAMQHPDASKPKLVFRVQDTGGQPVFVQLVERLMSSAATVYMVVFSIPKLLNTFPAHSKKVTDHLLAIAAFAQDAPLLLVGTRKGEASEAELKSVSDQLRLHIEQHCPPSVARMALGGRGVDGMCFFAVENSQGYAGDDSIRELVQALERAAASLPSMRQRVPLAWLQVYDALRRLSERQRHVPLGRVRELAEAHGMPHRGLTLEQEVASMLQFFHSLNAVLWWGDVPDLAGLVILDPQWMIDAASCFIRDFGLHDHTEGWEKMRLFDERARREELAAWKELTQGSGILHRCVLDILWQSQDFSQHRQELLLLMRQFGLLVPLPNRADQYLVPALLDQLDPAMAHAPAWRALLDGRAAGAVVLDAADLSAGFAPAAVFSRFCTAALACGAGAAEGWVLRQDPRGPRHLRPPAHRPRPRPQQLGHLPAF
ncbi:unnamed protein product [Prorocentrum cordatum]|nr:unnamed protein product [Polarella glacialis]